MFLCFLLLAGDFQNRRLDAFEGRGYSLVIIDRVCQLG